jgi:hypothetical protein
MNIIQVNSEKVIFEVNPKLLFSLLVGGGVIAWIFARKREECLDSARKENNKRRNIAHRTKVSRKFN